MYNCTFSKDSKTNYHCSPLLVIQIIKFLKRSKHLRYLSPRVASSDDISAARDICVRLFLPNKVPFSYIFIFSYIFQYNELFLFATAVKGNIYIWTKIFPFLQVLSYQQTPFQALSVFYENRCYMRIVYLRLASE